MKLIIMQFFQPTFTSLLCTNMAYTQNVFISSPPLVDRVLRQYFRLLIAYSHEGNKSLGLG
jgi:hypothetical protein